MEQNRGPSFGGLLLVFVFSFITFYILADTLSNPTYQGGATARNAAWQQTFQVWGVQAGETARVVGIAAAAVAGVGLLAWGIVQWQRERTRRTIVTESHTTKRAQIGAQRDVVLAYIAAYGGRAGELAGERGVFLDASGEFVPWHVAQQELDAARLLTVDA